MLLLLEFDANPSPYLGVEGQWTLLHTVCDKGDKTAIRLLLLYGANWQLKNSQGLTPLDLTPANSMTRRYFQETSELYNSLQQNRHLAEQAIEQQKLKEAARYLLAIANCWQAAAASETHPFLQQFYYHKALEHAHAAYQYNSSGEASSLMTKLNQAILPYVSNRKMHAKLKMFVDKSMLDDIQAEHYRKPQSEAVYSPSLS